MLFKVKLPWPPKELSPNSRPHWAAKAKAAKAYRRECYLLTLAEYKKVEFEGKYHLYFDFYPKTRRRPDDDNCLASAKSGRDGIADAMGVDDKRFISHPLVKEETGGYVMVTVVRSPE